MRPIISDFAKFLEKNVQITKRRILKNKLRSMAVTTYICGVFKPIQKLIKRKNGNLPYTLDTNRANCWKIFSHTFQTHLPKQLVQRLWASRFESLVAGAPKKMAENKWVTGVITY